MTTNYVFFIGGSGARVYKAFIHGSAAGIIKTKDLSALVIDADKENAASKGCIDLYRQYKEVRDMLGNSVIDAFACNIEMMSEDIISPVSADAFSLNMAVGNLNETRNRLVKALYTEKERGQDLRGGFYAHPNIGCVFFTDFESKVFDNCLKRIEGQLDDNQDVAIALVGSVFGGTGAAGIPTIFKMLNEKLGKHTNGEKLHIGGVFLEPYFRVNGEETDDKKIAINMDEFYFNTYEALSYYNTSIYDKRFQSVYLLGQSTQDVVSNNYASSGNSQKNKPHIIELYAALAIDRFLQCPEDKGVFGYVRRDGLGWNSFPLINAEDDCGRIWKMANFMRAQSIFITEIYRYIFEANDSKIRQWGIMVPQWYAAYILKDSSNQKQAKVIAEYGCQFVEWAYMISSRCVGAGFIMDDQIQLFGGMLEELYNVSVAIRNGEDLDSKDMKGKLEGIRKKFDALVTTVENAEYVLKKVWEILSLAGIIPLFSHGAAGAALGTVGLLIKIASLVSEKK